MRRFLKQVPTIIVLGIIVWLLADLFLGNFLRNTPSRDALRTMHREIEVGLSQDDVLAIYERHKTGRTKLQMPQFRDTWGVGMPHEFGATDPILYIQFDPASRVSAVAMRTSDGIHLDPPPGFPDKGSFHMPDAGDGTPSQPGGNVEPD